MTHQTKTAMSLKRKATEERSDTKSSKSSEGEEYKLDLTDRTVRSIFLLQISQRIHEIMGLSISTAYNPHKPDGSIGLIIAWYFLPGCTNCYASNVMEGSHLCLVCVLVKAGEKRGNCVDCHEFSGSPRCSVCTRMQTWMPSSQLESKRLAYMEMEPVVAQTYDNTVPHLWSRQYIQNRLLKLWNYWADRKDDHYQIVSRSMLPALLELFANAPTKSYGSFRRRMHRKGWLLPGHYVNKCFEVLTKAAGIKQNQENINCEWVHCVMPFVLDPWNVRWGESMNKQIISVVACYFQRTGDLPQTGPDHVSDLFRLWRQCTKGTKDENLDVTDSLE